MGLIQELSDSNTSTHCCSVNGTIDTEAEAEAEDKAEDEAVTVGCSYDCRSASTSSSNSRPYFIETSPYPPSTSVSHASANCPFGQEGQRVPGVIAA